MNNPKLGEIYVRRYNRPQSLLVLDLKACNPAKGCISLHDCSGMRATCLIVGTIDLEEHLILTTVYNRCVGSSEMYTMLKEDENEYEMYTMLKGDENE